MLSLGEFSYENFNSGFNQLLFWILFVLSTMITMVVFMNMLIAQMGDTYDECQEKREVIVYMNKLRLMHEFSNLVDLEEQFEENQYLFVVEKKQAEGMESKTWEGKLV